MLCVPPTTEIEPLWCLRRKVILAMEILRSPSKPDVTVVPSAIPNTFEDVLGVTVMGSWKANKVPKGVVV